MGFKLKQKTARIVFEEGNDYHGAEVEVVLAASLGEYMDVMKMVAVDDFESVMQFLAKQLVSWNLEDDAGVPIPANYEAMRSLPDPGFVIAMMRGWQKALAAVVEAEAPLEARSSNGGTLASLS